VSLNTNCVIFLICLSTFPKEHTLCSLDRITENNELVRLGKARSRPALNRIHTGESREMIDITRLFCALL
jgi:hypothetical protein